MIPSVGIVGYGNFGTFVHELAQRFFPDVEVKIYSRRAEVDNETFFSLETTASCEVVILCGAIKEYEEQLKIVLKHAPEDTIIVDVATVKKYTSELCKQYCEGRRFFSTHPMFGPESYKKHAGNVKGFRIVVTDYVLQNDQYLLLKEVFTTLGFLIIEMTADEHDKRLAETLFLTHYVGQMVLKAGFERTSIDTLSFQFLMDAVESVKDDKELFMDVYAYNPYCSVIVERLEKARLAVSTDLARATQPQERI
jgi:prephenate dehydrogenase